MKGLLAVLLVIGVASASAAQPVPSWYDREIVHNAVHDLEEGLGKYADRVAKSDSENLKSQLSVLQKAVDTLHEEMSDPDREADAQRILKAFLPIQAPFDRFLSAVRQNQLRLRERARLLYDTYGVMSAYGELKFWMTPVP